MDLPALYKTIALCAVSVLIEIASASKQGKTWFENLRRPRFSFGLNAWYIVGSLYYLIFAIATYRQFHSGATWISPSIILLVLIFIANGMSNLLLFKLHSLKWFYLVIYPFALLLICLVAELLRLHDNVSAGIVSAYLLWLIYDLYYTYYLWKLNQG
jgi:translocator protein